mmetsp:Transcript_14741/g.34761  ORF Transcript_14741/g.34761 Transcript_14741/m.34761 type:complete len:534 (-) Transcript_14741:119-1720(-)
MSSVSTEKLKELKESFKVLDADHDGKLYFKEFFTLLKKGNPDFLERQAELLFRAADEDLSGTVDFAEFVDFLFHSKEMERIVSNIPDVEEENAKTELMQVPHSIRVAASSAAKARGSNWRDLSWTERLEEVRRFEESERQKSKETVPNTVAADSKKDEKEEQELAKSTAEDEPPAEKKPEQVSSTEVKLVPPPASSKPAPAPAPAPPTLRPPAAAPRAAAGFSRPTSIADMNQEQLVDYSIQTDDFSFVGNNDRAALREMQDFKEYLRTAKGPEDVVEIQRYIAKGTAGWVFQAEKKPDGGRVALKLIRMTQARTGMKEWYVSKLLRAAEVTNVVYTDETVRVLAKQGAVPIVANELQNAGPVPYYICMMQEFLEGGTLEKLANEGKLSLQTTLRALEEVSHALAAMHANNVQHRDVKPENVLLEMSPAGEMVQAKVCDFGCAEIGASNRAGVKDDVRRFGVTFFSVITGEWWTKNRLIHEGHENLVQRMQQAVEGSPNAVASKFPDALAKILACDMRMDAIAALMTELREAA